MDKPVYDLIIGAETMTNMGIMLDFRSKGIIIDFNAQPMQPLKAFRCRKDLNSLYRDHLEPQSMIEETKQTDKILDAKYKKANLPEVIEPQCKQLSTAQLNSMLKLLLKYKELFDGALRDF